MWVTCLGILTIDQMPEGERKLLIALYNVPNGRPKIGRETEATTPFGWQDHLQATTMDG